MKRVVLLLGALSVLSLPTTALLQVPAQKVLPVVSLEKSAFSGKKLRMQLGVAVAQAEGLLASSTFWGGALAGGLHAIAGPDHYPALLPRCLGKRWYAAGRIGAVWGIGHSLSAMALGLVAFIIKDRSFVPGGVFSRMAALGTDVAVGLSMILVGIISLQESFHHHTEAAPTVADGVKTDLLINGLFHGLAIDGLPTMMPVLAAGSLPGAAGFLLSYSLGSIGAMAFATILIGQGTASLAQSAAFDVDRLVRGSAVAAVVVGSVWVAKAVCAHA